MDTEQTYTVEVTGEQAHVLASWISMMIQLHLDDEEESQEAKKEMEKIAPVGKRFAEIAEEAGEWEGTQF